MSLNVLTRPFGMVVDPETKDYPAISKALIFATMYIGIDQITEGNAWRFWVRLNAWERCVGHLVVTGEGTPYSITIEDVRNHIGLRTNAFPEISGAEYAIKLYSTVRDLIYTDIRKMDEFGGEFYKAQEVLYPLEQHEQHGTLECGCPVDIVADEGHQEGCEHHESYDED